MEYNLFIEQLKKRDGKALETLVKENHEQVFKTCLGYLQNEHDAADLTQEVFLKALERIDQYKGNSKVSTWLVRIAINLSLNFIRDNKKRLMQVDISDVQIEQDNKSSLLNIEIKKNLRKAIYKLPEKQRKVFILSYYLDHSYKEIEELTGYSISSIESLLFRSRKKLREMLSEFYNELK